MVKVGGGEPAVGLCDAFCGFFVGGDGFQGIDLVLGEWLMVASMAHAIPQGRTIDVRRLRRPSGRRDAVCGIGAVAGPDGQDANAARSYACDVDVAL
ncbi:hypothetical protein [Streptomyces sp. NPDC051577]|uniref:hypothetical protein n=1 Tax=Streptomyces sp. NPDC051577 TaxID=3155166 RepID=UPI003447155E